MIPRFMPTHPIGSAPAGLLIGHATVAAWVTRAVVTVLIAASCSNIVCLAALSLLSKGFPWSPQPHSIHHFNTWPHSKRPNWYSRCTDLHNLMSYIWPIPRTIHSMHCHNINTCTCGCWVLTCADLAVGEPPDPGLAECNRLKSSCHWCRAPDWTQSPAVLGLPGSSISPPDASSASCSTAVTPAAVSSSEAVVTLSEALVPVTASAVPAVVKQIGKAAAALGPSPSALQP